VSHRHLPQGRRPLLHRSSTTCIIRSLFRRTKCPGCRRPSCFRRVPSRCACTTSSNRWCKEFLRHRHSLSRLETSPPSSHLQDRELTVRFNSTILHHRSRNHLSVSNKCTKIDTNGCEHVGTFTFEVPLIIPSENDQCVLAAPPFAGGGILLQHFCELTIHSLCFRLRRCRRCMDSETGNDHV